MGKWLVSFCAITATAFWRPAFASFGLESALDIGGLSPEEAVAAHSLLGAVEPHLPPPFKRQIVEGGLGLGFKSLVQQPLEVPGQKLFLLSPDERTVWVERQLLCGYFVHQPAPGCGDHDSQNQGGKERAALTIIRGLFSAWNRLAFSRPSRFPGCHDLATLSNRQVVGLNSTCRTLYRQYTRKREIVDDIVFNRIIFWREGKKNSMRPIASHERSRLGEYAAINFERFLLDPHYRCRRPSQYHYFAQKFHYQPFPTQQCSPLRPLLVTKPGRQGSLVNLDPERVYQVHYLLAGKRGFWTSAFGHSLLRLVVCAPERRDEVTGQMIPATPMGPQCLKDTDYHLVASFFADTGGVDPDGIAGVLWGYTWRFYLFHFADIAHRYARRDLRSLHSFPLLFSRQEMGRMISQMQLLHWDYQERTAGLAENCATRAFQLIQSVKASPYVHTFRAISPFGIPKHLAQLGLIDQRYVREKFHHLPAANIRREATHYLQAAFRDIWSIKGGKKKQGDKKRDLLSYLSDSPSRRERLLQQILQGDEWRSMRSTQSKRLASFLALEKQAWILLQAKLDRAQTKAILSLAQAKFLPVEPRDMVEDLHPIDLGAWGGDYGIPQDWDGVRQALARYNQHIRRPWEQRMERYRQRAFARPEFGLPQVRAKLRHVEHNIDLAQGALAEMN